MFLLLTSATVNLLGLHYDEHITLEVNGTPDWRCSESRLPFRAAFALACIHSRSVIWYTCRAIDSSILSSNIAFSRQETPHSIGRSLRARWI